MRPPPQVTPARMKFRSTRTQGGNGVHAISSGEEITTMYAGAIPRWLVWLLPALAVLATGTLSSLGSDAARRPPLLSLERQVKEAGDSVTFNARGTELAVCDGTTVKILDARTLSRKKRYEGTGDRVAFA